MRGFDTSRGKFRDLLSTLIPNFDRAAGAKAGVRSSGGHDERCVDSAPGRFLAIQSRLADDTEGSPRDRGKALGIDFLFAANAESKGACMDAAKRASYFCKLAGIALEIVDRQVAIAGVLDSVQLIRTCLDGQSLAAPASVL
jgi:hypothetical protein